MDIVETTHILRREFAVWGNRLDRFFWRVIVCW